jgi:hypothetical protein
MIGLNDGLNVGRRVELVVGASVLSSLSLQTTPSSVIVSTKGNLSSFAPNKFTFPVLT